MEKGYIYIDNNVFPTLLALSEEEQSKGLMHQSWPPPVMSFVYDQPRVTQFWMKNTPSPLDIVFCCNGKVRQICKGEPNTTSIIGDYSFSDLVVELPYGTANQSKIKIGSEVGLFKPDREELRKIFAKNTKRILYFI
jgi:uncharacterized membrane protein (UPF0127 family)